MKRFARWSVAAAASAFAYLGYVYLTIPDVRPLARTNPRTTAFMELRARQARAAGKEPRRSHRWVSYRSISPSVKRAVLVAEDAAFWSHDGVDYEELQKSIELDWARGEFVRGASTITQQLAKNLYLSPSRNPVRKLRELIIARRLEAELDKARIFEIYLNVIEWGDGIYGIDAAARTYFGVPASGVGPSQAALLAGAIINPRLLTPARPTPRLLRRQQLIMRRMGSVTPPPPPAEDGAIKGDAPEAHVPIDAEAPAGATPAAPPPGEPTEALPSPDQREALPVPPFTEPEQNVQPREIPEQNRQPS